MYIAMKGKKPILKNQIKYKRNVKTPSCWMLVLSTNNIVEKFTLKCKTSDFSWKIYTMTSQKSNLEKKKNPMSKLEVLNVKGYDFLVSFFTVLWSVVKNKSFQSFLGHMWNYIRKNIKNFDFIQIFQIISLFFFRFFAKQNAVKC